jgi:predicted amidohydrolase
MRVSLVQFAIAWEDPAANFARVRALLAADPPAPGGLVVLPEMFATGFTMDAARAVEGPGGEQQEFVAELARTHRCVVLGGVVTRTDSPRPANAAVAFDAAGRRLVCFGKLHGFSPAGEGAIYAAGPDVATFPCGPFAASPLVCYDLRFPEVFRRAVDAGADLFVVPANWPARRERHWLALLAARAIENQAYVVGVNRVGSDPNATYSGRSVVIDPMGVTIADAGEQERVVHAELDAGLLHRWRQDFPALRDRRRW